MVYFGGFFPKLEFLRGFLSVYIIYITGRVSAAVMAGDIIFFCLDGPVGDYTAHTLISRGVCSIQYIILQKEERSCNGRSGGGSGGWGHYIF